MSDQVRDKRKQLQALQTVKQAIESGNLTRSDHCQLCNARLSNKTELGRFTQRIIACYWKGYDFPLEVIFVCQSCNTILAGKEYHNGTISIGELKTIIACRQKEIRQRREAAKKRQPKCKKLTKEGKPCSSYAVKGKKLCSFHLRFSQ